MMMEWDDARWPNFTRKEVACQCCGELVLDDFAIRAMDTLQRLRRKLGEPLTIVSGHRCAVHNAIVGGAADSMHLKLAFDIAAQGHDRARLYTTAKAAGFTGFGFMEKGLHADTRTMPAHWDYGPASRRAWAAIMPPGGGTFEVHPG